MRILVLEDEPDIRTSLSASLREAGYVVDEAERGDEAQALTDLFIGLVEQRCAGHGLELVTPRDHALRGSQVGLARKTGAFAIMQALITRGVIGDFRAGSGADPEDILRFGLTPLYVRFVDVWHAVEHLRQVMESGEWQRPEFNRQNAVT